MPRVHYIVLRAAVVLAPERRYSTWREIQDSYPDYVTSLGPWTAADLLDYLADDFGDDEDHWPLTRAQIAAATVEDMD